MSMLQLLAAVLQSKQTDYSLETLFVEISRRSVVG
jgi:hypothetical protein